MFLCCVTTTFAQFSGSGSGTENDPFLITNPIHLNQLRNFLNQSGVYFKMMADVDLTEFLRDESPSLGWQPVGTSSAPFKGILDGNGKHISGLWINRPNADNIALFAVGSSALIKNLTLKNVSIEGKDNVGALIGSGSSTINNCIISGNIKGNKNVGGYAGDGKHSIADVVSYAEIDASEKTGGIIGSSCSGSLSNCRVYSNIYGLNYTGGICGYDYYRGVTISNCIFIGNIVGRAYVGGVCGYLSYTGHIHKCFVGAHIEGQGDNVGGIVGWANPQEISNDYFTGTVTGKNYVGGIIGCDEGGIFYSCYTNASIVGNKDVGGICGTTRNANITKCVSIVSSVKAIEGNVGRIYGSGYSDIGELGTANENKALNRTIVISAGIAQDVVDNKQNGAGVSPATLKLKATYVAIGWDFTDTWRIQETECYPYFKIQTAPPVITSEVVSGATTISGKCEDGGIVTLDIDGTKQQMVSSGHEFSFTVSPLQVGREIRICTKVEGKEQSYYTTEIVQYHGSGNENDPYQVYTSADLTGVYRKGYFKLMNDIDLTDYINQFSPTEGWESIGREGSETIHFDGNRKKITGLWCNSTRDNTGLFSCFANGTIKNLTVEVASGKQVKGGANTGILIGKMINGTIENCKVSGTVADGTPVGGIVGLMDNGKISLCEANVALNTTGERSYVGGIVGEITGGTLDQCVTTGTLTATGTESYVGGLVGKNYATITNCYSTADNTSSYNAAGIVAYNYSLVEKCLYTGNLYSNNYAAGIIGYNDGENAVVQNCVATSNKIEVVYESQQVQQGGGYGQRIIGGIKNNAPVPEMNNYALNTMQASLNNIPQRVYDDIMNGVAKTNTELKQKATYQTLGWDFANIWNIDEGSSYPYQTIKAEGGSDPVNPDDPDPQTTVEVTDVTNMANAIYVVPLKGSAGSNVNIEVKLKNANSITSYGFELVLPAGVTISTSTDGDFDDAVTMSGRHKGHTLTTNKLANNTYKVGVASLSSKALTDNDGLVLTIKAHVADNIAEGEYAIGVQSPLIVNTDGTKPAVQSTQSKITIEDYTKGDVDGDGVIDLADAVLIINHYVGKPVAKFNEKAADVDGDGVVDLADAVRIINFYVGKVQSLAPGLELDGLDPQ